MSFDVPTWWPALLLMAASFRVWHLLAHDTLLDRPRRYVLRISPAWREEGDDPGDDYRLEWGLFLNCPYCAGFWVGLGWLFFWELSHRWTEVVALPFVISTGLIALAKVLTQDAE